MKYKWASFIIKKNEWHILKGQFNLLYWYKNIETKRSAKFAGSGKKMSRFTGIKKQA
jgi:hypothetical protein